MIIKVKVKTSSSIVSVKESDSLYTVSLRSKPHNNFANIELIDVLASHFNIPKSSVNIIKGLKSKTKLIEIG